jgi:hypothetical protein
MQRRFLPLFLTVAASLALLGRGELQAEPLAELASFSAFKTVNLDKLASGTVMSSRGTPMSASRDLAVESLYVVRKTLAKTGELHLHWNGARHSELKVYLHGDVTAPPTAAQYQRVGSPPSNASTKALMAATEKLGSGTTDLQMSQAEAKAGTSFGAFWSNLLHRRAEAYFSGGPGRLPPYETKGETVRSSEEFARLLKDAGKLRARFSSLVEATPLGGGKGSLPGTHYWEMVDVEGLAAVNLGAFYHRAGPSAWQAVDVQYYSSGGYYVFVTFYQMWPVNIGGQECTLVWRGDLLSSAGLASLRGVERMGSSTAMMRETQKSVKALLADAAKAP